MSYLHRRVVGSLFHFDHDAEQFVALSHAIGGQGEYESRLPSRL